MNRSSIIRAVTGACLVPLMLAGCGSLNWFDKDEPPLPGERIAVRQTTANSLTVDAPNQTVTLPAPVANADWPQNGGGPGRDIGHVAAGGSLNQLWSRKVGSGSGSSARIVSPPIVASGRVYTLDAGATVTAVDAASGGIVWSVNLTPETENTIDGFGGGLAHSGDKVFVSSGFGQLHALSAASGEVAWTASLGAPSRAAPAVAAGKVFAVTRDNRIAAVDAATGEVVWTEQGLDQAAGILGGAAPAATQEAVVAPFSSGELNAYLAASGRPIWVDDLTGTRGGSGLAVLNDVAGDPVISDGAVYAASQSGRLVAVDLRSGDRKWTRNIGGVQTPYVAGPYLFFVSGRGDFIAMLKDSGEVIWNRPLGAYRDPEAREDAIIWAGPIAAGGRLLLTSNYGLLVAIDPANGGVISETTLPGGASTPPVAAGGTVYVLTDDATLVAYR